MSPPPAPCVLLAPAASPQLLSPPDVPTVPQPPAQAQWSRVSHKPLQVMPVSSSNPSAGVHHSLSPHAGRQVRWFCRESSLGHLLPNRHLKVTLPAAEDTGKLQALEAWLAFFFLPQQTFGFFIGSGNTSESFLGVLQGHGAPAGRGVRGRCCAPRVTAGLIRAPRWMAGQGWSPGPGPFGILHRPEGLGCVW